MNRRMFIALSAVPAITALLQACGDDDESDDPSDPDASVSPADGPTRVQSDKARVRPEAAQALLAAAALNSFGADVHRALAEAAPSANLVFSPASILLALVMARAGAEGTTASEMDAVLHIDDPEAIYAAANALSAALETRTERITRGYEEPVDVQLSIANSVWVQQGLAFRGPFLDILAEDFGAGLELVDYRTDAEGARVAINEWVAKETKDRIPELLVPGVLTPDSSLTLVNAIYLKAQWLDTFNAAATTEDPFTLPDGSTVDVPMMHISRRREYSAGDGWQAVHLPYAGRHLAMVLVLPDGDLTAIETDLDAVFEAVATTQPKPVDLSVPRWDTETKVDLTDVLGALGMPTAFTDDADFSGMTTEEPLFIGAVIHQANITVDEEGTEAAAATAVVMEAGAAPGQPEEPVRMTFDRPYLFAIRDVETGAIIFQGRITDPR